MCQLQDALEKARLADDGQVRLISITLDPKRDTPEVLRNYMRLYDADANRWTFLTGDEERVAKVVDAWGMWVRPAPNAQLDHPSRVFLVDSQSRVREIYDLSFLKAEWVLEDIRALLDESAPPQKK
jgi:cytochrome oxidase Cu insertion factor (SCO1/SenC/PrrC family)